MQSGDDEHALVRIDPQATARIDDHGIGRRRRGARQGFLGAYTAQQEADTFGSASPPPKTLSIQAAASCGSKKPDRYWSAPARPWACRKSNDFSRESIEMLNKGRESGLFNSPAICGALRGRQHRNRSPSGHRL
jgi:hypothetical protein